MIDNKEEIGQRKLSGMRKRETKETNGAWAPHQERPEDESMMPGDESETDAPPDVWFPWQHRQTALPAYIHTHVQIPKPTHITKHATYIQEQRENGKAARENCYDFNTSTCGNGVGEGFEAREGVRKVRVYQRVNISSDTRLDFR